MNTLNFKVEGSDMQMVSIFLEPGQSVIAEAGSMLMMEDYIDMKTIFGDGSKAHGGVFGSLLDAGKRAITGAGLFMTLYTNKGSDRRNIVFAPPTISQVMTFDLEKYGEDLICHKDAFLCAEQGTKIDIAFTKRFGAGLFAGEGFILQKMRGNGTVFLHACGNIFKRDLSYGEILKVDAGSLVAMTEGVSYSIQYIKGIRNKLFGNEGMFFMKLEGPGTVWLQTLPIQKFANTIIEYSGINNRPNGN